MKITFDETEKNETLDWKLSDSIQSKVNGLDSIIISHLLQLQMKE